MPAFIEWSTAELQHRVWPRLLLHCKQAEEAGHITSTIAPAINSPLAALLLEGCCTSNFLGASQHANCAKISRGRKG